MKGKKNKRERKREKGRREKKTVKEKKRKEKKQKRKRRGPQLTFLATPLDDPYYCPNASAQTLTMRSYRSAIKAYNSCLCNLIALAAAKAGFPSISTKAIYATQRT